MTVRPIDIRMGGYGPPQTGFSRALKRIGERLQQRFGDQIEVKYVWNIMDLGYRADDILGLVESGILTLGYQSSSYLTDQVPELGFVDLPFLFDSNDHARAAMDGPLGAFLAQKIEEQMNYRILGWFENGFRHISNRAVGAAAVRSRRHAHEDTAERRPQAHLRAPRCRPAAHGFDRGGSDDRGGDDRRAGKPAQQHSHLRGPQVPPLPHLDRSFLYIAADLHQSRPIRILARGSAGRNAGGSDRRSGVSTRRRR